MANDHRLYTTFLNLLINNPDLTITVKDKSMLNDLARDLRLETGEQVEVKPAFDYYEWGDNEWDSYYRKRLNKRKFIINLR